MADGSPTIQIIRENIKKELKAQYPAREIEAICDILFSYRLHLKKHEIGLKRKNILTQGDQEWFSRAIMKLKEGCPVQYITGQAEFFGLLLDVTPDVLIPRPETEELVQWIIGENTVHDPVILDIGTGSGCIALALKKHIPGSSIIAVDVDGSALVVAAKNASNLQLELQFFLHDILAKTPPECFPPADIIVSNPPYIPRREREAMPAHVRDQEPATALFVPDDDPLQFYTAIAGFSREQLEEGGQLYLEIHEKFGTEVLDLLKEKGFVGIELRKDINGKERMIKAIRT